MSYKVIEQEGGMMMLEIDGKLIPMFYKTPEDAVEHLRKLPNMPLRDDDVMLYTHGKAGTHWGYEILSMLLKGKAEREQSQKIMLMMEAVSLADMEAMPSPRILNTHLPLQFLPQKMAEKNNKMLVIMRNPKDVLVSGYYHVKSEKQFRFEGTFDDFLKGVMSGKVPYESWFEHTLSVEKAMENKEYNIHLTFFEDLKENGVEEIKKIAKFLETGADEELCKEINDMCAFKKMAAEKDHSNPMAKKVFKEGFSIYRKGVIGDWKNHFTVAQNEAFDKLYAEKMKSSKLKFRFCDAQNN